MKLLKEIEGQKDLWYALSVTKNGKCDGCGATPPSQKIRAKNIYLCEKCATKSEYAGESLRSAGHLQIVRLETSVEQLPEYLSKKTVPPHTVILDEALGGDNDLKSIEQVCDQLLRTLYRKEAEQEVRKLVPVLDDDDMMLNHAVVQEYRRERTTQMQRVAGPAILLGSGVVVIGAVGVGIYAILHPLAALFWGTVGAIAVGKSINVFLKTRYRL